MKSIEALLERIATAVEKPQSFPSVHKMDKMDREEMDNPRAIVIDGQTYTSSKLIKVINWLKANPNKSNLTVREIAQITDVSKSWVAIAKKYKEDES